MLYICSPRRWTIAQASFLLLAVAAAGLAGSVQGGPLPGRAVVDEIATVDLKAIDGDPIIVSLPFEKAADGVLQPNADAWAALLDKARRNPKALLVIRPTGDLAGIDRADQVAPDSNAAVAAADLSSPVSRLDAGSTALLRAIAALRKASPGTKVSVLGLPLERNRFADQAATSNAPYGQLLRSLDAFVSARGLLNGSAALDDRAWMNQAMPSAVRLAQGRSILFRTPAGWQQRSIPVESFERGNEVPWSDSAEARSVAHFSGHQLGEPYASEFELGIGEDDALVRGESRVDGPRSSTVASPDANAEAAFATRRSDQAAPAGGPGDAATDHADPITDPRLSDFGGGLLDQGSITEADTIDSQTLPNELQGQSPGGSAAVSPAPRSLAILPRALRAFAPLAIGGDLIAPGAIASSAADKVASSKTSSNATVTSRNIGSGVSTQTGGGGRTSGAAAASPANSSAPPGSNGLARSAPAEPASGSPAARRPPTTPTPSRAPGASRPVLPTPRPSPAAPPVGGSTSNPLSSTTGAPPPINPVVPITPPTQGATTPASSASTTSSSSPIPPRDWSTLPVNVGNADSHIGGHAPGANYYSSEIAFANLIYSSITDPAALVRGLNRQGETYFGTQRFHTWSGTPYYTDDGWPFRSDIGALSRSNAVHIVLSWGARERMWSALGLTGTFQEPPIATEAFYANGTSTGTASYPSPRGIAGRSFTFDVTCYWEGTGTAVAGPGGAIPPTPSVTNVSFTGPDGEGPFGDGPRTMSRSTTHFADGSRGILAYIIASDATGADPLRNLVVLVSNVRDAATGEVVYDGFDHTNYKPFQLYPHYVDNVRHYRHIRPLPTALDVSRPHAGLLIHEPTGVEFEWHVADHGSTTLMRTGWHRPSPSPPGFERGFAAINRPTHVGFSRSLRAMIEICNQLDADLWWLHPVTTVFVGSRDPGGGVTYARRRGGDASDPEQVGSMLIDEEYVNGFTDEISAHLKPGLKVYSEYANEVWNAASSYLWGTRYAWTSAMRMIAPVEYGGDGGRWFSKRVLGSPATYAGVQLEADANQSMPAFSAAASARLADAIRERLGSESTRELVCVAAGQNTWPDRSAYGLGQFWAAMPRLFRQLDAVAHAPYRSWWNNSAEADAQLANEGSDGIWQQNVTSRGVLRPYALFPALTIDSSSWWAAHVLNRPNFVFWKLLALDYPETGGYQRRFLPPNWPAGQRRWNLGLLTYEGGNHHIPVSAGAKLESYAGTLHPSYMPFTIRYMETIFGHGPKGLTRDPASAAEEELYRDGMVPTGVVEDAEPLHDRFTFLITTSEPSFRHGMFWGLQWWNGHLDSPQAAGAKEAVRRGLGTDRWWE